MIGSSHGQTGGRVVILVTGYLHRSLTKNLERLLHVLEPHFRLRALQNLYLSLEVMHGAE